MSGFGPAPWVQQHWDARAAANFMLGGAGAGLVVASALEGMPALARAAGLAMVAVGLTAVWLEIGRKLRAAHVFFNPRTSWMTRESFAAVLTFVLGFFSFFYTERALSAAVALSALLFLWCQARILRASKGIPAWRAPELGPVIVATGLAEGAALGLLFAPGVPVYGLCTLALLVRALAWARYRGALRDLRAARALEQPGRMLLQLGTVLPFALLLASPFVPQAAWIAGLAVLATGWRFKFALLTRASYNQGFALKHVPSR